MKFVNLFLICAILICACKEVKEKSAIPQTQPQTVQTDTTTGTNTQGQPEQNKGQITGTVTEIYQAVEQQGSITIKTPDGTEKMFQYLKDKTPIDSTYKNKNVKVYWSLQVDTNSDEANSFYQVDSINKIQ
jgi:hypothetical protein